MKRQLNFYPTYTTLSPTPSTTCHEIDETVFDYPFFNEGVSQEWSSNNPHRQTDIDSVTPKYESLGIKGFIFHTSHCGSTLLARMMQQIEKLRVISEPEAINGLLLSYSLYDLDPSYVKDQLKKIMDLYLQSGSNKNHAVFKLTSWNVFYIPLFHEIYPDVPWLFIDRETNALMQSLLKRTGGFIDWWDHVNDSVRKHFILSDSTPTTKESYLRSLIEGHRYHAQKARNGLEYFIRYPAFATHFDPIFDHFGLTPTLAEEKAIREIRQFESKSKDRINRKKQQP